MGQTVSAPDTPTHHGLSLGPFAEKTVCCLLLEVSRLSLGVLNGLEVLLTALWPLRQAFVFACANDVRALEAGDAGEGEGLHIELCLLSAGGGERTEFSTASGARGSHGHTRSWTQQAQSRPLLAGLAAPPPLLAFAPMLASMPTNNDYSRTSVSGVMLS